MNDPVATARHWLDLGRHDQALAALDRLSGEDATGYPAVSLRATALWMADRNAEAARIAEQGLAVYGPDPGLLSVLGGAYRELGRREAAERALLDGLALEPESTQLLCTYAHVCIDVGQLDKAAALIERAAALEPDDAQVAAIRTLHAIASGDISGAQRLGREALAADPESTTARGMYGAAAAAGGDVGPAYQALRGAAADRPDNAAFVEAALDARVAAHPLLRPLVPLQRLGPLKVWLAVIVVILGLRWAGLLPLAGALGACWFLFAVYSWVAPPLVRKWLRRR
ncbi:tetratricopeptide repeat protein [Amycolatopsis suaedae]|uniref:Uncharacterized protein n=1 Tax=Amycolatopsis suaedae TaxID=2510978 RepID=A0A4Q7J6J0_9PSEU|nr:tetratricopeptide repeat protein [Amycolatopsis suaedae]RZQ62757.1 hypothetical protein EWH70_17560 [Amycolatopsis suaedae]